MLQDVTSTFPARYRVLKCLENIKRDHPCWISINVASLGNPEFTALLGVHLGGVSECAWAPPYNDGIWWNVT